MPVGGCGRTGKARRLTSDRAHGAVVSHYLCSAGMMWGGLWGRKGWFAAFDSSGGVGGSGFSEESTTGVVMGKAKSKRKAVVRQAPARHSPGDDLRHGLAVRQRADMALSTGELKPSQMPLLLDAFDEASTPVVQYLEPWGLVVWSCGVSTHRELSGRH